MWSLKVKRSCLPKWNEFTDQGSSIFLLMSSVFPPPSTNAQIVISIGYSQSFPTFTRAPSVLRFDKVVIKLKYSIIYLCPGYYNTTKHEITFSRAMLFFLLLWAYLSCCGFGRLWLKLCWYAMCVPLLFTSTLIRSHLQLFSKGIGRNGNTFFHISLLFHYKSQCFLRL